MSSHQPRIQRRGHSRLTRKSPAMVCQEFSREELLTAHANLIKAMDTHLHALRGTLSRDVDDAVSRYMLRDAAAIRELYAEAWRRGVRL